jgi:hypothetical protein
LSVVYNGAHSITFIEALDSDTDSTPTAYSSYKRSWRDFHLVPEKRPSVNPPSPALKLIDIPGTNRRIDMTDLMPGGLKFGRRQGEWQFILDHDLWDNWHTAKKTIEDAINGKRLYCILEDDFNTAYRGRFRVQGWQSGPNYSSIAISYDLEYKKYTNAFNVLDDVTENKMLSSWSEVDKMIWDGSYKNNLVIGDSAYLYLPEEYADYVDVAGIDIDIDSTNKKIPVTWIAKKLLNKPHSMAFYPNIGWGYRCFKSSITYQYLNKGYQNTNNLIDLFPDRLQKMIVAARKTGFGYSTYSSNYETNMTEYPHIWIPSYRELFSNSVKETTGVMYTEYFPDNRSRIRTNDIGILSSYNTRTAYSKDYFYMISSQDGTATYGISTGSGNERSDGTLIGFCTGAST